MIDWGGKRGKYLAECGFEAVYMGMSDSNVFVCANSDDVVVGVTSEQAKQVVEFLGRLEQRVQQHIDIHYNVKTSTGN